MFTQFHGDIDRSKSVGTNNLIRRGAKLVTSPEDIVSDFEFLYKKETRKRNLVRQEDSNIKEEYKNIYKVIGKEPMDINEIAKLSKESLKETMPKLTMLELDGKIKSVSGNRYIRNETW